MSLEAMVWALKSADVPDPIARLVLIGLADHADAAGRDAWPARGTLAEYAHVSVRTVASKLRDLEERGMIRRGNQQAVAHLRGDRRPVVYDLAIHGVQDMHGVKQGAPRTASRGENDDTHGVKPAAHKPSLEPYVPPTEVRGDEPEGNAGDIVGAWIDQCASRPPSRLLGQVAREVRSMLDEGIPYRQVLDGTLAWAAKGLNPSALASVVHEVGNPRTAPRGTSHGDRVRDVLTRERQWALAADAAENEQLQIGAGQ